MARIDHLKEAIAFEKQLFFLLLAGALAALGWLFANAGSVPAPLVYGAVLFLALLSPVVRSYGRGVQRKIRELEDL